MPRAALRSLLALLLIGTFGFRVGAPAAMSRCAAGMEYPQHSGHGHGDPQHHHDQGPTVPACECVGHSCSSSVASLAPTLTLTAPRYAAVPPLRPESSALRGSDLDHLLPFAHGPPPSFAA